MVFPVGLILSEKPPYSEIYAHVRRVVATCADLNVPVKVIIETGLHKSLRTKIAACIIAAKARAAFVKTCTGFNAGQATEEDVKLMWRAVQGYRAPDGQAVKIKASGGVRTLESCLKMLKAGAERIGTCVSFHASHAISISYLLLL